MARLLIVDDDPQITSALARGLSMRGYEVVTGNRYNEALDRLLGETFDGAIIDVMLGSDSGLELVRAARKAGVACPILMLSALSEVEDRTAGLEAGADDYVVKPFSLDELVARMRVQENRVRAVRGQAAVLTRADRCLHSDTEAVTLTGRECELLEFLISKAGTPISRGAIFDRLWLEDGSANENVVDVYIGYLRKKLKGKTFSFEIKTVRNEGFRLDGLIPTVRDS